MIFSAAIFFDFSSVIITFDPSIYDFSLVKIMTFVSLFIVVTPQFT